MNFIAIKDTLIVIDTEWTIFHAYPLVIRYGFLTLLLNVGFRGIYKDGMVVRDGSDYTVQPINKYLDCHRLLQLPLSTSSLM
jgi:hypothetical protein